MILSVLDQSPIASGRTYADALNESLELARQADASGYHRYWFAEHHNSQGLACSAPEIMIARVAAETSRIRVGSGGVMLPHYASYKVAEQFALLETLYPGRIDLGIGRAPGSDQLTAAALAPEGGARSVDNFPRQVQEVEAYLKDEMPDGHPFARVHAVPMPLHSPQMWLLGSSDYSATVSAVLGMPFCFAHFIAGPIGAKVMESFRNQYRPSPDYPTPHASVAAHVICAPTMEEADQLARGRDVWRLRMDQGIYAPFPSPAEAEAVLDDVGDWERQRILQARSQQIIGDAAHCKREIEALAAEYGVDEVVIVTITHDFAARCRSYQLLADAFALTPAVEAA
jgi:luciferase family oxidoreductase group 1